MNLRDHIEAVREHYGSLTPQAIVDAARPKTHPLHSRFEWNNSIAGEAWRRRQAQELIREVRVIYREADDSGPSQSVRAYHAVRGAEDEFIYEPAERVAQDPLLRAMVLRDMERDWKALHRRYAEFEEFVAMVSADLEVQPKRRRKAS